MAISRKHHGHFSDYTLSHDLNLFVEKFGKIVFYLVSYTYNLSDN